MIMAFLLVAQPAQRLAPTDVLDAAAALTAHLIIKSPGQARAVPAAAQRLPRRGKRAHITTHTAHVELATPSRPVRPT